MDTQFGPNSIEERNLLYKLHRKIQVFHTNDTLSNRGYNFVTSSSKYGVVFIASPDSALSVYQLSQLIDKDNIPQHISVKLGEKPSHIAVSCDQELLAVTGGQQLYIYKVIDFENQNVSPSASIRCDVDPNTFVSALQWNPCIPDAIALAFYDGTLLAIQVSTGQINKVQSNARCICWSPKGKQLVTGNSDGTLCQYKPNLAPAKSVPAPNLFDGAPVEALAIYWISTFQFAVVYKNATQNSRPAVTIVNTPKAGQPSCLNYEDICYSMGSNRPWYYFLQGLPQWNMILSSSSNSMEISTLGSADGVNWQQWCQSDEARPELPLTDKKIENYPVGICIDTCAIHQLPWGENEVLPHMPLLHVVSQTGLLTIFNIINLNKQAVQLCTPPQGLTLPAAAMIEAIPGEAPQVQSAPVPTPTPVIQQIPQPIAVPQPTVASVPASSISTSLFASLPTSTPAKPTTMQPLQVPQAIPAGPTLQLSEQKPVEIKSGPINPPQNQFPLQPKPTPLEIKPQPSIKAQEANAALKAEQEQANKIKANQELKNMLVREVNEFQMELYKFMLKTRETQAKLQRDLQSINSNFNLQSMDTEELKKECSIEELRSAIVQLKLELVKACAVVAEARTHADSKDLHEWTQADPLTTKRVASVKKLAYYVQNQVEQAHKALDYKWNEVLSKDQKMKKPGQYMIRPILDDVYQPLVKQQEILCRQQAMLKTLRNTLKECEVTPVFKSTSLLRSTPFRNKDPLSKLTKNILNMSIEPQTTKSKESILSAQKLDALRDMLSNHKTVKIKPVNVDLRQQLAAMKISYEKSLKEKLNQPQVVVKSEPDVQPSSFAPVPVTAPVTNMVKIERTSEPDILKQQPISIPSFTPVNSFKPKIPPPAISNVARTLFTNEPKSEPAKPQPQLPQVQIQSQPILKPKEQLFTFSTPTGGGASANTRSVLKDLLQSKSQANVDVKNDANTFMGQRICSPTVFAPPIGQPHINNPPSQMTSGPSAVFTAKPISDITNMFTKFQPQTFVPESKPQTVKPKSSETGELEGITKLEIKKEEKPLTNLFGMKTSTPLSASSFNVPDAQKTQDKAPVKQIDKIVEKIKENTPEKTAEIVEKSDSGPKLFETQSSNKTSIFGDNAQPNLISSSSFSSSSETSKPIEVKSENKTSIPKSIENIESSTTSTTGASFLFASANATSPTISKPQPIFPTSVPVVTCATDTSTKSSSTDTATASSASSIFSTAVASQSQFTVSKTPTTQTGSIFSTSPTSTGAFAATGSIFGTVTSTIANSSFDTTTQSVVTNTTAKPSAFSSPTSVSPSSVFGPAATQSVFGSPTSVFATTTTTQSSIFATSTTSVFGSQPSTQASAFATSTASNVFGTTTTTSTSIFTSTPASTSQNVFGASPATTQASVFGNPVTSQSSFGSTSPSSVFGATSTQTSVFGTPTSTTQSSIFGSATQTSQTSLFGTATQTTQASIFGSPTQTTQASVFGTPTQTTQASVFGSPTQTTQASVFGSPTPTTQASVFGSPTQTTQASVFGTPTQTTQASIFGTPTQTTQTSVFGTPTQTTQTSVFGTPTQTTQASIFGGTPTTSSSSGSLFGSAETNLFASASISTTSAPSQSSGGNIFGGGTGSVFGSGNTNIFGAKSAFSSQSNTSPSSIFGGGATFGQKPANNFWSGGNASGGGFGSGFGQQATTQAASIFGSGSGGSFSAPSTGQPFGSPQQNANFGENKPSVFGSPQQQSTPAFGGSPVFGSKPVFGQSATSPPGGGGFGSFGGFNKSPGGGFGAPATFGGGATFGGSAFGGSSPGKVFGGSSPSPGFGSPTQSNATFESLATQNTLTFGNLAQQSGQQPQPQQQPTFNTSPSFTGWRG
ncbi:nuclear pore complex protein Nup214-like isoform X2 [Galleria mellonella]|uniref:Nuclear pore complex protein Nup214-like isoform X2 n=1 Tax=Galleria mellonella TaxID=7137 RepID=A0A6J1WHG5_GALME|nr:nuclear pore complex protein Nup214-like isoform X2 [Galleria mellonella]